MFDRLRSDFHLAIIALCGGLAVIAILPFALYRLLQGQLLIVAFDLALVAAILGSSIYAWRTGRTARAGTFMGMVCAVGLAVLVGHIGITGVLWSYTVLALNYFIAPRMPALVANGVLIGGILLHDGVFSSDFDATTYAVTALLVSLFAFIIAVRSEVQRGQLEAMASHDTLTGAGNRRLLELDLRDAMERYQADTGCYGVALLDLDRFKVVNDDHGHDAGDAVLRQLASIVGASTRKFDRFYRFGGEEFVLLMPVGNAVALTAALEKVQARLREDLRGPGGPVTVSFGAAMPRKGEHWSAWLARADAALYRAKRAGRDRIVLDGEGDDCGPDGGFDRRVVPIRR